MTLGRKLLWGSLGWVTLGPIGAILGYAYAQMTENDPYNPGRSRRTDGSTRFPRTRTGDFIVSLLVLFAKVMKADDQLLRSELDYVKSFLLQQLDRTQVRDYMIIFKEILQQDYALKDVCRQIQRSMDHPSRIELIHVLFGLSQADGNIHPQEIRVIHTISRYLNVNEKDFESVMAMFIVDSRSSYTILEINSTVKDNEVKRAYRKMANKYHPDKVAHLGPDLRKIAEEKFKAVNNAYQTIKKERGIK